MADHLHEKVPYRFDMGDHTLTINPADGSIRMTADFIGGPKAHVLTDDELVKLFEVVVDAYHKRFIKNDH